MGTVHQLQTRTLLGFVLLFVLVATPLQAAEKLSLDDMVALLSAGIDSDLVLKQAERTGTRLDPEVKDLLALSQAGAGERLLTFLMETAQDPVHVPDEPQGQVRVYVDPQAAGGAAIVLTNLDANGKRQDGGLVAAGRGVISSSERLDPAQAPALVPAQSVGTGTVLPTAFEITLNRPVEDERMGALEDRLRDLETTEPQRPPVGADLPRHAINDFREYPVVPFGYGLGYGYAVPVVRAQKATVTRYGSLPSFTSAAAAGIDPFRPVQPCSYGQACSVHQRLAYPNP